MIDDSHDFELRDPEDNKTRASRYRVRDIASNGARQQPGQTGNHARRAIFSTQPPFATGSTLKCNKDPKVLVFVGIFGVADGTQNGDLSC